MKKDKIMKVRPANFIIHSYRIKALKVQIHTLCLKSKLDGALCLVKNIRLNFQSL